MDTTLLYQILESKDGVEHTSLELMESWLVQFPHNPIILKLINSKKEALGIEISELDWNQLSLSTPRFDDFFVQLDYDVKIPDKHIDIETNAIEELQETGLGDSDFESSQQSANNLSSTEEPSSDLNHPEEILEERQEEVSRIESNLENFMPANEINAGMGDHILEQQLPDNFINNEDDVRSYTENWTDEDEEDVILYGMEDEYEIGRETLEKYEKHKTVSSPVSPNSKESLSDFTAWLKKKNPNSEQNIQRFYDSESQNNNTPKKQKKKSKKLKKKEKQQVSLLKKQYNIKINKRLRSVIEFADQSLLDPKDIISETLAEILVEQEHYLRAIDMYHRLSLAFPEKSVYFAEIIKKIQKK